MSFSSLGLSELILRAVDESGYTEPTPIQVETIPVVLSGKDVLAAAQTGTGKTAGFTLPLLQRLAAGPRVKANHIRTLVLTPTRELAVQVAESVATYGKHLPLKSGVVYGGVKINPQMMRLRSGVDVLVATPGRLMDLFRQNAIHFAQVETLVLDEADRMLDMGFIDDILEIIALLPKKRQNLLFSATFSNDIRKLSERLLNHPVQIEVSPRNSTAERVKQTVYEVDKSRKSALLSHLILNKNWQLVLVFTRTKNGADHLAQELERAGISTVVIHGDKKQNQRSRALKRFKEYKVRVLVATDVAARGLDINELPHVVNFDLPKVCEDYVHRIGRTGRAGSEGEAVSLVSADEINLLAAIETLIRQTLTREVENGFIPKHRVPLTHQAKVRPKKPKKPKRQQERGKDHKPDKDKDSSGNKSRKSSKVQDINKAKKTAAGKSRRRNDNEAGSPKQRTNSKAKHGMTQKSTTRNPRGKK
ncbi:DEAD/DEAH box helicase [Deltaproteobacteria bacterium IMCC39524]|nr:DEAD/DEAH box helicase [Deltaproteobacteria bacterium IMCC39524]